ncbi:DUF2254 domain-containing protein [Litoreibacter roseus]|uniref:DUF2254 domain-containing protein n=1 Tax=Litoreibacter roseus TaxID=2601869 RepID=A0A6N6JFY5_9RHOB|nr:DUF2254 domain-containing protein [Litoreibacter roseus]GFE64289.1 hypothetical protein KIN_13630 [Litoreibacter roseus]
MYDTLKRKLIHYLDKLWVRITLIAILSLVAIGVARLLDPLLPNGIQEVLGAGSVGRLLEIIANSMLAVTTFSLTVMVSVFRAASSQWTPRSHRLMLDDKTTQNTLATFIGAYIYALSSIILLETQLFGEDQVVVLFGFTILILILIILAIVRWILHLQNLGSLIETTRRIETEAERVFGVRMKRPCLGANPLKNLDDVPDDAVAVVAEDTGYIQHIYEGAISEKAEELDCDVYLTAPVGRFIHRGMTLAYVTGDADEMKDCVRLNTMIGDVRTFEQDPRFGLVVLGEIGSKALSPGINDPGTAIDVIGRMSRILESYSQEMEEGDSNIMHPRLWVPPLAAGDLIEDGFAPLARDGGKIVEVQLALQKALAALADHPDETLAKAAKEAAVLAFKRAKSQMIDENDIKRLSARTPAEVQAA